MDGECIMSHKSLIRTFYVLVTLLSISLPNFYATDVSENQSGNWTLTNSPYTVVGNITLPDGQTLTIDPGVEIKFADNYQLRVQGKLLAQGTDTDHIVFISNSIIPAPANYQISFLT
jgi:hypothetical protein